MDGIDPTELAAALQQLSDVLANTSAVQPRPWTNIGRLLHHATSLLNSAVMAYLDAFTAPTPGEAQQQEVAGQHLLDAAALKTAEVADAVDRQERLSNADVDQAYDVMADIFRTAEGEALSILLLEERGEDLARSILPRSEPMETGTGLIAHWASIYVEVFFDDEAFRRKAQAAYATCRGNPRLKVLADSQAWRTGHDNLYESLLHSSQTLEAMLASARHDTSYVRAILLYIQDLTEGPQKHLAATLLDVATGRGYEHLMRKDGAAILHQVMKARPLSSTFSATTKTLRHASAHLDFRVENQDVIILSPGPYQTRMSAKEFSDAVLRALEDATSVFLAIALVLNQERFDVLPPSAELGTRVLLAGSGLTQASIEEDGERLAIEASGELQKPMPLVAAILALYSAVTKRLILTVAESSGIVHTVRADALPILLFQATDRRDELARQLRFMEACAATVIDDEPILSRAAHRHALAIHAGEATRAGHPIPVLRLLRDSAERVDDQHFAQLLTGLMRAVRLNAEARPWDDGTQRAVDELAAIESQPVSNPFAI
jgi:hypothetical protein